jgi:hypothetical protein
MINHKTIRQIRKRMSSDLERWWKDLPVLTKYLFVGSFGVTLAANFGLLSPYSLVLIWPKVITEFQLWRLVTCFLFHGKLGFPFLIHMLFLYAPFATPFLLYILCHVLNRYGLQGAVCQFSGI